jgi:hypothetical protein
MERIFVSIRDYIVARQQSRLEATAANNDDNDIVMAVPTHELPVEEDDVVVTATELSLEDMTRLRLHDPWMYHSIVNKITGHTVCNFDRIQSEDGDAAAGRPSSINGNQTGSFRLAASNSTGARNVVHRRRRFSTESVLPDPDPAWFESTSLGAGEPVAASRAFVIAGRVDQDEDANDNLFEQYISTLPGFNFQREDEVDDLSANVSSE